MLLAYINETGKYGTILASFVSRCEAIQQRKVSGDLVFSDNGEIDQNSDWLFNWEKNDPNCYARRMQQERLNVQNYHWNTRELQNARKP